jgi:uncharacterized protein YbjT (DUF2867 family)
MTAYVLGATGFVGREVVRQLCVRGAKVIAHVRPDSAKLADWRATFGELGAEVDTAAWEPAAIAQALDRTAATELYILIGTTRSKAKADAVDGDIYEKIDLGLTKIAVEAARLAKQPPRLVYLSGIGASASARGAYMRARGKAEDAVRGAGLPWVIARPAIITGDRDESRPGERIGAIVGDGVLAVAGLFAKQLRARYRSTTPDILASALIRIAEAPEHDRVFDGAALR